jgi:eukaryotic-like serine/threonine-protein kinase
MAPARLGRFEVGAKIGGGGMAQVYVGRALREEGDEVQDGPEELVALKVIRDEFVDDPEFLLMFSDEARLLARLAHPHVIRTLEHGATDGHRYIAMELLAGRTLADVWDSLVQADDHLDPRLAAWICARVAEGLHAAHEATDEDDAPLGIIHRDVNPTNIFLTHAGGVKLIDFGLAKARKRSTKSADGIVKGKIPYLAPEQLHLKKNELDRRIDVYALGATLWELVTMRRLFKRETDVDTLRAIRDAFIPDARAIADVPEPLWEIIDRALQRDRDDRYATAEDVRAELDAFVGEASDEMTEALVALMLRLYPGEEAQQNEWMRSAAHSARRLKATVAPPAPVPTASSDLLRDDRPSDPGPDPAEAEAPSPTRPRLSSRPPAEIVRPEGDRPWFSLVLLALVLIAVAVLFISRR